MKKTLIFSVLSTFIILSACEVKGEKPSSKNNIEKPAPQPEKKSAQNKLKAPDFTLADMDGNWVSLADMRGKVVLLNFWGTWCPPCRKEIPDFVNLYEKHKDEGLEIVGITLSSGDVGKIKKFMNDWKMNYTILTDIKGNETQIVTQKYGEAIGQPISGIPTTFIINRDGHIVKTYVGPRSEEIFYQDIQPYL